MKDGTSIKEKIIRESIVAIEGEVKKIDDFLTATPLIEMLELNTEMIKTVMGMVVGDEQTLIYLDAKTKERDALNKFAKRQIKFSGEYIKRKAKLISELQELRNELFHIERLKRRVNKTQENL